LIGRRGEEIRMTEVRKVLGVGNIHPFIFTETPDVRRCVRSLMIGHQVEFAAAMIDGIDVVIRHSFAAQVEVGAFDPAGNDLRSTFGKPRRRMADLVVLWEGRGDLHRVARSKLGAGKKADSHRQTEDEKEDFHDEQLKQEVILIKSKRGKRRQDLESLLEQRQDLLELFGSGFAEELEDGGLNGGDDRAAIAHALDGDFVVMPMSRTNGVGGDVDDIVLHQVNGRLLDAHVRFNPAEDDALSPQVF